MRIKKGTYLFIALLLAFTTGMAQMSMPFSMAPIASSGGVLTSSGGNPIVMDGKGKCLSVTSGLRTLEVTANNSGIFGASCAETPPVATVLVELTNINLYPNPTHSTSILKVEGQFDANLSCQIKVFSIEGRMMFSQMVPMKEVKVGYTINAGAYAAGNYVVSIDFMDQHYTRKLIKL
jgi:hypothetical protein